MNYGARQACFNVPRQDLRHDSSKQVEAARWYTDKHGHRVSCSYDKAMGPGMAEQSMATGVYRAHYEGKRDHATASSSCTTLETLETKAEERESKRARVLNALKNATNVDE